MVIASMAAWFTPTVLFCLLNLVIVTIFIASNFKPPHHHDHDDSLSQLARPPSLLQRVTSLNLPSFYTYTEPEPEPEPEPTRHDPPSQLTRNPSLLERVKSFDFSFASQTHHDSPSQLARAPSLLERVKSIKLSSFYTHNDNPFPTESEQLDDSVSPSHVDPDPILDPVQGRGGRSGKLKDSGEAAPAKMKKSRSERRFPAEEEDVDRRRPATMKAGKIGNDENVDAKADDFINRFKQQLKLQRLDSIARLKEMMMNRGTASSD